MIFEKIKHGPPSFRFYNFIVEEHDFLELVKNSWQHKVQGNLMFALVTRLRRLEQLRIKWKK